MACQLPYSGEACLRTAILRSLTYLIFAVYGCRVSTSEIVRYTVRYIPLWLLYGSRAVTADEQAARSVR